jgi:hypothetical protein
LRAYLDREYNTTATAAFVGVSTRTVMDRRAKIEKRLGCRISDRHAELDMALRLEKLLA